DVRISRRRKNLVAEDRDVSLNSSAVAGRGTALGEAWNRCPLSTTGRCGRGRPAYLWTVLPDQVGGPGIQRLDDAARIGQIHDAVVNQRRGFICACVVHRPRPRELKLICVLPINLIQRTIAPCAIRPSPVQPIAWCRIPPHRLRDRPEFSDLREEPNPSTKRHHADRNSNSRSHKPSFIRVCARFYSAPCPLQTFFILARFYAGRLSLVLIREIHGDCCNHINSLTIN